MGVSGSERGASWVLQRDKRKKNERLNTSERQVKVRQALEAKD